jgi:hypothetical protein
MNDNPSFASVLDAPVDSIERPKPLPVGTYAWAIEGRPEITKSKNKGTDQVNFVVSCLGPADDVDASQLSEAGGWQGKKMRLSFWPTENAAYRLKEFLLDDLQLEGEGKSMRALLDECSGMQFSGHVKHEMVTKDGQGRTLEEPFIRAEIDATAPIG